MKKYSRFILAGILIVTLISSCDVVDGIKNLFSEKDVLYINLVWHQHQPLYYKVDNDTVYTRPWVRAHATKDYYDMAAILKNYPDIHATFNITPVLLRQIDDFVENGAKDMYWILAEKPAADLTDEDKTFILTRFFDANYDNIIGRFPRYQELLNKRGGSDADAIAAAIESFSEQDMRDLQIWFNLAWFDPMFLEEEPLLGLVEKGEGFSEADKEVLFAKVEEVMAGIIPLHREMQESGQIEVITTPYAHPILPLIYNSDIALVGNPSAEMPPRFSWPNDAIAHLQRSVEIYEEKFGQPPNGLWPGEGSVSEDIVPLVIDAGYQWMATGEPVLAQSLGIGSFTRNSEETIQEADMLYRPYYVETEDGEKVAIFFRDWELSDKIGFEYSQTPAEEAADNLIQRLENIYDRLKEEEAEGPNIVSIILDGENAWEYYPNDGVDFLNAVYAKLSEHPYLRTITPTEYLKKFPEQQTLDTLFPGAWFSPNYDTWIGETEEQLGWTYLGEVRDHLAKYDVYNRREASPEAIALAQDYMYLAEGSDWFWWYGADQSSGVDEYFDLGFRELLKKVYLSLGDPVPAFLDVPIIPKTPVAAERYFVNPFTPELDGVINEEEWQNGAYYAGKEGDSITGFYFGLDAKQFYAAVPGANLEADQPFSIYITSPRGEFTASFVKDTEESETPVLLGISASVLIEWDGSQLTAWQAAGTGWQEVALEETQLVFDEDAELQIPLSLFGDIEGGDEIRLAVYQPEQGVFPEAGPAQLILPDIGLSNVLMVVEDPEGDDHGPGSYTYPTDAVFEPQVFDIKTFTVAWDDNNMIFKFELYGPISNAWGSGINLSIQTMDVYVDTDPGEGTGARLLLPGRNAALEEGNGWEIAVWAEGWESAVLAPDPDTLDPKPLNTNFKIIVNPASQTVTIKVPRENFPDSDPSTWGYAAVLLSQDGYPSTGVWRVRNVGTASEQWVIGGGTDALNQTRILDMVWPAEENPSQEDQLSTFDPITAAQDFEADDYALIKLIQP